MVNGFLLVCDDKVVWIFDYLMKLVDITIIAGMNGVVGHVIYKILE